jgi:hypothetical protein
LLEAVAEVNTSKIETIQLMSLLDSPLVDFLAVAVKVLMSMRKIVEMVVQQLLQVQPIRAAAEAAVLETILAEVVQRHQVVVELYLFVIQ